MNATLSKPGSHSCAKALAHELEDPDFCAAYARAYDLAERLCARGVEATVGINDLEDEAAHAASVDTPRAYVIVPPVGAFDAGWDEGAGHALYETAEEAAAGLAAVHDAR